MNYVIEPAALRDLAQLLDRHEAARGWQDTLRSEQGFWSAFALLSRTPGLGHRRPDLTDRDCFFYLLRPYFIVYRKQVYGVAIAAVLHSARDLPRALQKRL